MGNPLIIRLRFFRKLTMQSREERLKKLKENPEVSVLIVGAGINGIGTFRDLSMQGIDVVLIDKSDFCSGASSASSHMVHGGIRYLENGEFSLVQEAVQERNRLIENAPHLVKALPTTIPIFNIFSGLLNAPLKFFGLLDRPAERGALVIKIGMSLYDFFTRKQKTVPKHKFINKKNSLNFFPKLNPDIKYTGTYYDGAMASPERIAIELIKDAERENENAIPLNYFRLISAENKSVVLRDENNGETIVLKPKILINASGPWIDFVNLNLGQGTQFISGTKGSHLILGHSGLREAIGDNEFFFENNDGRIVLIYPLHDKVLVGSSDIRVDDPKDVVITEEEIDYFIEMIAQVFPKISVDRSHIVYTFSGVRPLQHTASGTTGQISRNHIIKYIDAGELLDFPILSLVGGKWTSFRAFSEEVTNEVLTVLRKPRQVETKTLKIGGGKNYPKTKLAIIELKSNWAKIFKYPLTRIERLFNRYGTLTEEILKANEGIEDVALKEYPDYSQGEIKYLIESENVVHLDDLFFRRSMIAKLGQITEPGLKEIAEITAKILQWNSQRQNEEIQRVKKILNKNHRMDLNNYMFFDSNSKQ